MNDSINILRLAQNIRRHRQSCHLTQKELAKRVGCSPSAISNLERGTCLPSVEMLFKIAHSLNCHAHELVEGV